MKSSIATFSFGAMTLILDAGPLDAPATLGFQSDDCDRDFRAVTARGAVARQPVKSLRPHRAALPPTSPRRVTIPFKSACSVPPGASTLIADS